MEKMLKDIVIQTIKDKGPISFHDFMETALYYPGAGYYSTTRDKIGPGGDFYTSSNVTPIYGELVAKQLEEMWHNLGEEQFTIVEFGAGTGSMCHDILNYLRHNEPLYSQLQYCIIERNSAMQEKEWYQTDDKVKWCHSIADLKDVTGCIISNELIDNFAVHQVVMKDELMEVYVDYTDGFRELLRPAPAILKNYFKELNVTLPLDYRTEVNLEAVSWIHDVANVLKKGYVLTIDYGFPSDEMYRDYRRDGTLVCYNKHAVNYEPYTEIGKQDITSHVNFSSLSHWGEKNGLGLCGFTNQALFLLSLGIGERLAKNLAEGTKDWYKNYRQNSFIIQNLLIEMGHRFKVLIQQKGLPKVQLSGLKLATPYRL